MYLNVLDGNFFDLGKLYLEKAASSRNKITKICNHFIRDGAVRIYFYKEWYIFVSDRSFCFVKSYYSIFILNQTILTHSRSRVVLKLLKAAAEQKRRFNVFVTVSAPDQSGFVYERRSN